MNIEVFAFRPSFHRPSLSLSPFPPIYRRLLVRPDFDFRRPFSLNFRLTTPTTTPYVFPAGIIAVSTPLLPLNVTAHRSRNTRRNLTSLMTASSIFSDNPVFNDFFIAALAAGVAFSLLRLWGEIAKRGLLEKTMNRKLVHISIGLVFLLFWPLFSSGQQGAYLAALVPGVNIIRMLLIGRGIWKDEATVKSMSRSGDYRELLKGPLYYASTITLASVVYWRSSPIAIATICNLCAGDGVADIVGRRFGRQKLPYNRDKSFAGSIAMASAGFITSIGYMHYFSLFGLLQESWGMTFGFLIVSSLTAIVESLPISSELDDNLTVPLTSLLVGSLVF